jgi:hypothetical protein
VAGAQGFISLDLDPATVSVDPVPKSGYFVTLAGNGSVQTSHCNGTPTNTDYTATAVPENVGTTGQRGFNMTGAGTIFAAPAGGNAGTTPIR